jgi:TP901 family phage tail tape measure protein
MIISDEVGVIYKIINEASPTLVRILKQVRELNAVVEKARANLAELTKGFGPGTGLAAAIGETDKLALAWKDVAKNASEARMAMRGASGSVRLPPPSAPGGGGVGNRGVFRPGARGTGGGAHFGGPGVSIPGGGHVNFRGGAAAAAGLIGYGAYEAAEMEDAVWQLIYHSGQEQNDSNRSRFRKILQDAMGESGYGLHDISESAKQEIRMFQGTLGGGIDVLPEMLRAATIESRLKGESPEESMKALIGLAHMTKQYSPDQIKKLAPAFAFLSTANPGSLSSIERAAGYAVPLLQSGLEIDPMQSLLLGTALTRAGATSTKSGTWLREMALRAMPGTSMMSKMAFKKHEEALREMGLVDDKHRPTWFTNGKPDLLKMLDIAGERAQGIPLTRRAAIERSLFGAQGGGGFALLADPAVRQQVQSLGKEMNSPEFKNRYASFSRSYLEGSTVQNARTAMAEFNNTMMDLGAKTLPAANIALGDLKRVLEAIRGVLPKVPNAAATIGARTAEGVAIGAGIGYFVGGVGAVPGAAIGGVLGTAEGFMETYGGNSRYRMPSADRSKAIGSSPPAGPGGVFPGGTSRLAPITLNLNLDGRTLGTAMSEIMAEMFKFSTEAPAADGIGLYNGGGE